MALEKTVHFKIEGMTCASCSARLEKVLSQKSGIIEATVNLVLEQATIRFVPKEISTEQLVEAVQETGFEVAYEVYTFAIKGMTCASCSARLEKVLGKMPQVISVTINLALEQGRIHWALDGKSESTAKSSITKTVVATGFSAVFADETRSDSEDAHKESKTWREGWFPLNDERAILIALLFASPLILNMFFHMFGIPTFLSVWMMAALATVVQFWVGSKFYIGAWKSLRGGGANMDVLVALGTSAAYFFSLALVLAKGGGAMGHLYFDGAAIIITLILLGKVLENRAKAGAAAAISALMAMRSQTATISRNGQKMTIPIDDLVLGDKVIVRPGELFPVDGVIIEGVSEVDEALITGESLPIVKKEGDEVTGGALNGTGLLMFTATAVGEDTTLSKIISLVENAQNGKAPVQKMVDRVAEIFVPVVVVIAIITFAGWMLYSGDFEQALVASISVLVIACPCALGLATPTALVAGTGAAAKAGILIKDIETLERTHKTGLVIFDKTGTLTQGKPEVQNVLPFGGGESLNGGRREAALLKIAATIQQGSEHPLGKAILRKYLETDSDLPKITSFQAIIGAGVEGQSEGKVILAGNLGLMIQHNIELQGAEDKALSLEKEGQTVIYLAQDQQFLGLIGLADQVKEGAKSAILSLRDKNIKTMMVSGDAEAVVQSVARSLGLDDALAQAKPEDKANIIAQAQKNGVVVTMVGDGVNDAPALALADVGIAMGTGSDVALETAGITLMRPDPRLVPAAYDISGATWRKIMQNLFWAFIYNIIGIPLAAFGMLNPAFAGVAMAFSSVSVVTNSLLLRRWKPKL